MTFTATAMETVMNKIVMMVLNMLETQTFSDSYEGDFVDYISAEEGCKTEEEIKDKLAKMLKSVKKWA